jgi:hypothetical protein
MQFRRKIMRVGLLAALLVTGAGCGGFNGSHSVSPASFFLPGLLKADPPPPPPEIPAPQLELTNMVAQVR